MADVTTTVICKVYVCIPPVTVIGRPRVVRVVRDRPVEGIKHGVSR